MSEPIFDSQRLMESVAGDAELAVELLTAYAEDAPVRMASLAQAVERDEIDQVVRAAHSLKGMSGVVRASRLVNQALGMEMTARNQDMDGVRKALPDLRTILDQALAEMRDFMDGLG